MLHYFGLTTTDLEPCATDITKCWACRPFMRLRGRGGEVTLSGLRALWLTNDRANHRIRILYVPELEGDLERACHHRLQHFAFEYSTLDDLLSTDARLKSLKIEPLRTANQGATIYLDPDGNCIELLSDAEGDRFTQTHVEWESRNHTRQ